MEGSDGITLTVKGKDFISTSMVQFADTVLPTELVDSTQLKAKVPAEMLRQVGTYTIRVVHRAPGWGKTNPANFIVKFK